MKYEKILVMLLIIVVIAAVVLNLHSYKKGIAQGKEDIMQEQTNTGQIYHFADGKQQVTPLPELCLKLLGQG